MGYGRRLKTLFWFYFLTCNAIGLLLLGSASAAYSFGNYCWDGVLWTNEECDDGNNLDGDGCNYNCYLEDETTTSNTGTTTTSTPSYSSSKNVYRSDADTEDASAIVDIMPTFKEITSHEKELKWADDANMYFKWNNYTLYKVVGNLVKDQEPTEQRTTMWKIKQGISKINKQVLETKYSLYRDGLVWFLDVLLDVQIGKVQFSVSKFLGAENTDGLEQVSYITPQSNWPVVGKPIVFTLNKKNIEHIDWHFGNGYDYACDDRQCTAVPVVYDEARTYKVLVIYRSGDGTTNHERFSIDVEPF